MRLLAAAFLWTCIKALAWEVLLKVFLKYFTCFKDLLNME